ncbi:MAG: hypothetical protein QNJ12_13985 [Ilumatobacter sp.]|uniref:hypothetical protein n=1 Tax=Ilumatobacter sp. TaxID=1967498 RepID=UPI002627373B|nr:hypothetical protein [Ilumatobacter sp.]MDJ0769906.1 hypothetical protein [Ilumatobacter sp.]
MRERLVDTRFPAGSDGGWTAEVVIVDDVEHDAPARLEIDDRRATVRLACLEFVVLIDDTTEFQEDCSVGGVDFGDLQHDVADAIETGGRLDGGRLVFERGRTRLEFVRR